MLGFSKKTRGELMREELGASWDHFLQAASHAANGVGSTVGPRATRMRLAAGRGWDYTLAPLAIAYREGAADARAAALKLSKKGKHGRKGNQMSSRRVGMLMGLLAAGAVVGAASALVVRRRRKQRWSEYEPSDTFDAMSAEARSMLEKAGTKVETAKDKTADKLESAASSLRRTDVKGKADEAAEAVNEASDELSSTKYTSKHNGRF
jgi:gas vesicle protein